MSAVQAVALVHLGRPASMGEACRVVTWKRLCQSAGWTFHDVPLLRAAPLRPWEVPALTPMVASGRVVPEAAAWSVRRARAVLSGMRPDAVVLMTVRAFHPRLVEAADTVVLDHVDQLSASYRLRAGLVRSPVARAKFDLLALCSARTESVLAAGELPQTAAGRADAEALGTVWVPNLAPDSTDPATAQTEPDHDVLFFGNLAYPPNVEGVERLALAWPEVVRRRPETTGLIAGRGAGRRVRELCDRAAWTFVDGFSDVASISGRARLAVAAITSATGIQNKVLEAAAHGLAQVISPQVLRGLDPQFPVSVAGTVDEIVDAVVSLLEDAPRRQSMASAAKRHLREQYSPERWTEVVVRLLSGGDVSAHGTSRNAPPMATCG